MNVRERFKTVMEGGEAAPPKWEFGYWGQTCTNWYAEGLAMHAAPRPLTRVSTASSSLYIPCWSSLPKGRLAAGIAVLGGGLYWPTQGFALDEDVRTACAMDKGQVLVDVDLLFYPRFEPHVLEENDRALIYVDIDGVKRQFTKDTGVLPTALDNPIHDRASWEKLKSERLSLKQVKGRFPPNWPELLRGYRDRDYPLVLGGYPHGYFGTLAHLMGYEKLFYAYTDDPALIHDIQKTFTDVWLAVYEEVLAQTDVDLFVVWEDISAGTGSMVSPAMIREFMLPYYKRLTSFLKAHGVETIFIDTDGECTDLIPLFLEAGITGMYPMEASCGVDIVKVRKDFPTLQMMGGIPKSEIRKGPARIEEILRPVREVLTHPRLKSGELRSSAKADWG